MPTEKLQAWINLQRAAADPVVTQDQIAAELGLSQAQVSRILSGAAVLTFSMYMDLARVIGFDPVDGIVWLMSSKNTDPDILN
tara:strand:- start:289 stop:537 length:249 start_codon:yes stop_codon:yes gene_type:complete